MDKENSKVSLKGVCLKRIKFVDLKDLGGVLIKGL